jgi:hypothetical protein
MFHLEFDAYQSQTYPLVETQFYAAMANLNKRRSDNSIEEISPGSRSDSYAGHVKEVDHVTRELGPRRTKLQLIQE